MDEQQRFEAEYEQLLGAQRLKFIRKDKIIVLLTFEIKRDHIRWTWKGNAQRRCIEWLLARLVDKIVADDASMNELFKEAGPPPMSDRIAF
jgi:hypothetical protein